MAKKVNAPLCDRCETPYRSAVAFCPSCGGPTPWTSHEERVAWEVRQWRANRASTERDKPQMMLVRTEAGYQPMPVARTDYVWDQPLHPERAVAPEPSRRAPAPAAAVQAPTPASRYAVVERPAEPHQTNDGNVNGHAAVARRPAVEIAAPAPEHVAEVTPPTVVRPSERVELPDPAGSLFGSADDRVTVSKKAVALGIALVVGLPFGGRVLGLGGNTPVVAPPKAAVAAARPAALVAARSGFEQLGPDAVRYAVVIHNPNKSFQASGVTVNVVVHDARGRLVGTDTERVTAIPAAGAMGVTGAVGVSGAASRMSVKVGTTSFQEAKPTKPFRVRDVRLSRVDGQFVVRASVSGVEAVKGARVVVIHLDRTGRVIGGDFTYVDVPRAPKSVSATISTAGVPGGARVEVYVLPR
ncbi:MAG: hypothetical protein WEB06_08300 [Actinomycetota bacterium]